MKNFAVGMMVLIVLAVLTPAAFAADGPGGGGGTNWIALSAGFSMAIASGACGYAQAVATAAACEGMARNPGATAAIRFALILGLVLIESMALYTFAIIFLKVS